MKRTTRLLAAVAALLAATLLLTSCGDSTDAAERYDSGLRGQTRVDGGCPVIREGEPCLDQPLSAVVVVTRKGESTSYAEVTSDDDGSYKLRLPPGEYDVSGHAVDDGPFPFLKPVHVTIHTDEFTTLDLHFDSGIR